MLDLGVRGAIAISLGAIAGALSRYFITMLFNLLFTTTFPLGTFVINLTGCVGIGFVATLLGGRLGSLSPDLRLLLVTGFMGSYTTFSTYGFETVALFQGSRIGWAIAYWLGSAIAALPCVYLGIYLARWGQSL